jgi:hypothetical protein
MCNRINSIKFLKIFYKKEKNDRIKNLINRKISNKKF